VIDGSPADIAGLRGEDLLLEVTGTAIERVEDLQRLMTADLIDTDVRMTVLRQGRELEVVVRPAELDTSVRRTR
jgi:S1-C subfamily serine protease